MTTALGIILLGAIFAGVVTVWRHHDRAVAASVARHPSGRCRHQVTTPLGKFVDECACGALFEKEPTL